MGTKGRKRETRVESVKAPHVYEDETGILGIKPTKVEYIIMFLTDRRSMGMVLDMIDRKQFRQQIPKQTRLQSKMEPVGQTGGALWMAICSE